MDWLAEQSRQTYRRLLEDDGFLTFFRQATPVDVIEESHIGSRPASRHADGGLSDLRAIPWVFSWSQSRFFLPAWFGVGTALAELRTHDPDQFASLSTHLYSWAPLHYVLSNVATCLAAADFEIMREYTALVAHDGIRSRIWRTVAEEFERSCRVLEAIYRGPLSERRPNIHGSLERRREPLRALHRQQIALLRDWRLNRQAGKAQQADAMLPRLLRTVNAIASGLGSTG
jgi:phosphoenolpyruvate carboxylase